MIKRWKKVSLTSLNNESYENQLINMKIEVLVYLFNIVIVLTTVVETE